MRELFDEVAGQSPLDPEEAVRRATRGPQRKRFYTSAGVAEADGGLAITLDGKPIRTPSGRQVVAPTREIAGSIAALHVVTTLTGSALLALALAHGVRDAEQVWAAAHVDEDWNIEKWGMDEEVAARRAARLVDFQAAVR